MTGVFRRSISTKTHIFTGGIKHEEAELEVGMLLYTKEALKIRAGSPDTGK